MSCYVLIIDQSWFREADMKILITKLEAMAAFELEAAASIAICTVSSVPPSGI